LIVTTIIRAERRSVTWLKGIGAAFAVVLLGLGAVIARAEMTGNFHVLVPGRAYRSAQLNPAQIADYQRRYAIRTIINLRGDNTGSPWYDAEVAEARKLGVAHLDFRMSSRRHLDLARAAQLRDLMARAQAPILIHCADGTDRTGLASAIYVAAIARQGEAAAERQMTLGYGHIPLAINPAFAMDRSWETLEPWLGFKGS
jgi:protein tyrosine/serine phosphatase